MTVGQLIERLQQYPKNMDVFIELTNDDFTYSLVDSVREEVVTFSEEPDGSGESCKDEVVIISDNVG